MIAKVMANSLWKYFPNMPPKTGVSVKVSVHIAVMLFLIGKFSNIEQVPTHSKCAFWWIINMTGSTIVRTAATGLPVVLPQADHYWTRVCCGIVGCANTVQLNTTFCLAIHAPCATLHYNSMCNIYVSLIPSITFDAQSPSYLKFYQ